MRFENYSIKNSNYSKVIEKCNQKLNINNNNKNNNYSKSSDNEINYHSINFPLNININSSNNNTNKNFQDNDYQNKFLNNDYILDVLFIEKFNLLCIGTVNNYLVFYKFRFSDLSNNDEINYNNNNHNFNNIINHNFMNNPCEFPQFLGKYFCPDICIVYSISIRNL